MSYQCLKLSGQGWASIADAPEQGLNMGLSDFMIEGYIKANPLGTGTQHIVCKRAGSVYYWTRLTAAGVLLSEIYDGVNWAESTGTTDLRDGRWHYFVLVVDRSSATGMQLYLGGSAHGASGNPTAVDSIDNAGLFTIGSDYTGNNRFNGLLDNWLIWNFGYGGLPSQVDYEAYIAWRATGRNRFLDISEYNGGAWNVYADADRTESVASKPGFEGGTGNWTSTRCTLATDGGTVHTGSNSGKMTQNNGASGDYYIRQSIKNTISVNEYYELSAWVYVLSTNTAITNIRIRLTATAGETTYISNPTSTEDAWVRISAIAKVSDISGYAYVNIQSTNGEDGDILYVDDVSVKRIGLVARYKFNGNLLDSGGSNNNDLTEGGSNNVFPGYTLKKTKIIRPGIIGIR